MWTGSFLSDKIHCPRALDALAAASHDSWAFDVVIDARGCPVSWTMWGWRFEGIVKTFTRPSSKGNSMNCSGRIKSGDDNDGAEPEKRQRKLLNGNKGHFIQLRLIIALGLLIVAVHGAARTEYID
jgi:hypothetical protein